jgi:hypothetical protein
MKKILFFASILVSSGYCAEATDGAIASDTGLLRRFIMGCQASPMEITGPPHEKKYINILL